jgi:hypothetical protein
MEKLGTGLVNGLGQWISAGLGSLVSRGVGAVTSWVSNLFSGGEGAKVNDQRDAYIAQAGGLHQLNVKAHEAGVTLDALLRAKKVSEFEAAVRDLTSAFDAQEDKLKEIASLEGQIADARQEYAGLAAAMIPGWSRASISDMGYWVDWANLLAIAVGFGAAATAVAWPLLAIRKSAAPGVGGTTARPRG